MALITEIRKRNWLLIALIGIALLGFVVMDMVSPNKGGQQGDGTTMGKVAGQTIEYNDFAAAEDLLYKGQQGDPYSRRVSLWNYFVENAIIQKVADKIGLTVGKQELMDLQFGTTNISPVIQSRFSDQATGQVNRQRLMEFEQAIKNNQLPADVKPFWAYQEKEIIKDRLQSKYLNMVAKGLYTPKWQADMLHKESNDRLDMLYVKIPFDYIDEASVKLTDADYTEVYNEYKGRFKQDEETRKIDYLSFPVKPSLQDSVSYLEKLRKLAGEWTTAPKDSLFVLSNGGTINGGFFRKAELGPLGDTLAKLSAGRIYGPFKDGEAFKVVKLIGTKSIPDSVRARHILIPASVGLPIAEKRIDSLKNLVETGQARFDSLASKFGSDGTATKGGDLGFAAPGTYVPEFNNIVFFTGVQGKLYKVTTQFGVHLLEITGVKMGKGETGYKFAALQEMFIPSDATQTKVRSEVLDMLGKSKTMDDLKKMIAGKPSLSVQTSPSVKANDFTLGNLTSGDAPRQIIRWAFENKKGNLSKDIYENKAQGQYYANQYVVASVNSVWAKGYPSLADVKTDLEPMVKNRKKGKMIIEKIKAGSTVEGLATQFSVKLDTAKAAAFGNAYVQGLGSEPKVLGAAYSTAMNQNSKPMIGNAGVFVVKPLNLTPAPEQYDLGMFRNQTLSSSRAQIRGRLMTELKEKSNIKDNRSNFF
jgi:peptidyl-prolyl cis-trans isomerase D